MTTATRAEIGTATKVAGFLAVLAVVFGVAWAAGARVGAVGSSAGSDAGSDADHGHGTTSADQPDEGSEDQTAATTTARTPALPGLAVAQDGYRLVLADPVVDPGTRSVVFTVEGPDGRPVTAFDVEHEKRLHLVVVRRDHDGFQHLHPVLDETTGTWTAEAALTPGAWRVFADFTATGGPALVLGSDLLVPGATAASVPVGETRADVVDGYTVTVDGSLRPGEHSELVLSVEREDEPVTDLQPYLGAYGHLVALREGDLAYLHVHPGGAPDDGQTQPGPEVPFGAEVPSAGRYHLYLDFRHEDVVRTAHLVLDAGGARPAAGAAAGGHGDAGHAH